jgi:long-chain acyl-CoA synthetase
LPSTSRTLTTLLFDGDAPLDEPIAFAGSGSAGSSIVTRGEMQALSGALAQRLETAGLAGAVIGVLMPNVPAAIAAWFGAWQAGCTVAPINPRVPAPERARMIEASGARALLTTPQLAATIELPVAFTEPLVVLAVTSTRAPRVAGAPPALMQFTSGTTGRPKVVPLHHDTILAMLDPVIASLRGDRSRAARPMPNLIPVSLSLWAGIYNVLFAFRVGAPVVLMERFDPVEFARLVAQYHIKSSVLPPAALVMLVECDEIESLAPLTYVRSVSAPLSPYQARRFHERFGVAVLNGYGQTELGGEATGWSAADWREYGVSKLGSVGRPHRGIELRVRGDDGTLLGRDQLGELEIRSASALPQAADFAERITDDGWLRTGDLARIDDDGFVWVEGRISAMINRGGLKVFPDEVEEVLRSHPSVLDAAVVGVPDDRLGEVPVAFLVAQPGHTVDGDELRAWAKERLAPYKVPVEVRKVDDLPRNEMGKLLRNALIESWNEEMGMRQHGRLKD